MNMYEQYMAKMQSKGEQRHRIIKQANVSDTVLTSNSYQSAVTYYSICQTNTVISNHWKDTTELKQVVCCRLQTQRNGYYG